MLVVQPHGMLFVMQQSTASAPAPASPNFASLLAALATPTQPASGVPCDGSLPQGKKPASAWDDDDLEDDIATLSYERALRTNASYCPVPTDQSLTQPAAPEPIQKIYPAVSSSQATHPAANPEPEADRFSATAAERNLKDASITIRMSKAERDQLRRRAAEAGLTVSAYLRSCTFEAESLRAMVKDTLSQLRSATTEAKPAFSDESGSRKRVGGLGRLLAPWRGSQHA